ncbi:hypothetical protein GCM10009612_29410 [Streptomyces beijiangensis]
MTGGISVTAVTPELPDTLRAKITSGGWFNKATVDTARDAIAPTANPENPHKVNVSDPSPTLALQAA